MGKVFIKTDVLGRPLWGIGERVNFTQTCAGSGLLPPVSAGSSPPRQKKLVPPMEWTVKQWIQ